METYIVLSYNQQLEEVNIFNNNIDKIQYLYINNKFDIFEINNNNINNNINNKYYNKNNFIKKYNVYIKNKDNNFKNECPICYCNIHPLNHIKLLCNHLLCKICYEKWNNECSKNNIKMSCPLCRK